MRAVPGYALWVSTAPDTRGGVATCVRTLQDTDLATDWSIRHLTTHRDGPVATRLAAFALGLARFATAMVVRRPVLVHLHTASYGSFARKAVLAAVARLAGIPVVLHVHGAEFHLFHDRAPRPVRWAIRTTLARSAAVIALGETWATRLRRISPGSAVTVVPNAVPVPPRAAGPDRQGAGVDRPVHVVFLGRIDDRKGAFTLIEAWAKATATADTPPARLTLAGDGESARARARVDELGLEVTVRDWLSPEEVAELLDSADVLALPSRAEGQPMAVLEAMARGVCVIGGAVGGIPEMLADGCGLTVPPDDPASLSDALGLLLDDPGARARAGALARERVRTTYAPDVVSRRLDALYREVTSR